jgi:hypothetical protein
MLNDPNTLKVVLGGGRTFKRWGLGGGLQVTGSAKEGNSESLLFLFIYFHFLAMGPAFLLCIEFFP